VWNANREREVTACPPAASCRRVRHRGRETRSPESDCRERHGLRRNM